jgi:RNA polymerase sigma-54 factor
MQLNLSQSMRMSQQMKLAPRMIQSMEILQLPVMALEEKIEQELVENVCLERVTGDPNVTVDRQELQREQQAAAEKQLSEREMIVEDSSNNEADFERLVEMASEWPEDNYTSGSKPSSNRIDEEGDRQHDAIANLSNRSPSLQEYLLEQFAYFSVTREIREFAEFLIQNLDHHGRLPTGLTELQQLYGKSISELDAVAALQLVQRLDPPGIGARDAKECLLLQVREDTPHRDVLVTIITSHLEDLAMNRLPLIQRRTGYSLEQIKDAHHELLKLNPFPGASFESRPVQTIKPDLFVEPDANGQYVVRLEDEFTPRLRLSKRYQQMLRDGADAQTKEYIKRKLDAAKWLIESIEQRYNTLKRVAQAIVDRQTSFLDHGPEHIVPLKMQQIADVVHVHVTTVSRAVVDKWIQTPRGLFPLKRFFGGGTTAENGEEVAWDIIRLKLKEIVDQENKEDPLSDDALVEELAKQGYQLARRTVTKYRKGLNIPSSRERRTY